MNKSRVMETLAGLQDEFNIEELIQRLLFIEKIKKGSKM